MKGRIAVKARLLDQSRIAGVGNLLADEALWQAKLSPSAPVDTPDRRRVDRLYAALRSTLEAAIASGGAHTGDVISARPPRRPVPALRGRDAPQRGRRPVDVVVLARAGTTPTSPTPLGGTEGPGRNPARRPRTPGRS